MSLSSDCVILCVLLPHLYTVSCESLCLVKWDVALLSARKRKSLQDLWSLLKGWCVTLYMSLLPLFLSLSFVSAFFLEDDFLFLPVPPPLSVSLSLSLFLCLIYLSLPPPDCLSPSPLFVLFSSSFFSFIYSLSPPLSLSISLGTIFFS